MGARGLCPMLGVRHGHAGMRHRCPGSIEDQGDAQQQPQQDGESGHRLRIAFSLAVNVKRSEEHTSELQSLMRISYAVFCLKKKNTKVIIATSIRYVPRNNNVIT